MSKDLICSFAFLIMHCETRSVIHIARVKRICQETVKKMNKSVICCYQINNSIKIMGREPKQTLPRRHTDSS